MREIVKLPGVPEAVEAFNMDFRPYNKAIDSLCKDRVAEIAQAIAKRTKVQKIDADFDFKAVYDRNELTKLNDINIPRTPETLEQFKRDGVRFAFHATNLLAWNVFLKDGNWIAQGRDSELGFWSVSKLVDDFSPGNGSHLRDYFYSGEDTQAMLERRGVKLSPDERELAATGVLIGIDLNGYETFKHAKDWGTIWRDGDCALWSICPPPPRFLKPVAVLCDPTSSDFSRFSF